MTPLRAYQPGVKVVCVRVFMICACGALVLRLLSTRALLLWSRSLTIGTGACLTKKFMRGRLCVLLFVFVSCVESSLLTIHKYEGKLCRSLLLKHMHHTNDFEL
ncbi:unnamed protein product, partial [Pylaiella littoralis]